ncbi:MAG: xanthine dehydrogenase family protein molybdopterin-binding subunit [Chloroflexota bacterium]|nr:xanthine dehydrogenase family protein molybdopterin-binding subunit [Chloroflexota bacterium]
MSSIGQSYPRIDAVGKVTGTVAYPGDIDLPGQLWAKVLFAGRPHARITQIDTTQAEQHPGVVAVFTAKDVPCNEYGLILFDQPVLCGPGSDKPGADVVRFVGDQVALIVAETEAAAAAGRDLIQITWEDLPIVTSPQAAMQPGAMQILPDVENNILKHYRIRKGDVGAAWASCAAIVEATYQTPMQEHAYLQPEAGVAYIDEAGRITVAVAGQWTHEDQEQIAHALTLPSEQVRVIYPAIGGAFGGREDMSIQVVLALAAWKLGRPVKIIWSREESMIGHHKRHAYTLKAKWGASQDGTLIAAECELISDAGPYAYTSAKVLGNATIMCTGPYTIPNVKVDAYTVLTNNVPGGAFRGFGGPQGAFAAEMQMGKLAAALGLDPVALRLKNLMTDDTLSSVGTKFPKGVTIDKVVTRCAEEAGWTPGEGLPPVQPSTQPYLRRGRGFGCAFKNIGFSFGFPERCVATIELRGTTEIEEVILYQAGADVGQGAHTAFVQMAADAVGVPVQKVRLVASDTANSGDAGSASASRLTFMAGNAIRGAAHAALLKWQDEERPATATYRYVPPATTALDPETGQCDPNFAYGYVAEAVEVEVDIETGHVRLIDVICADDVGKAINPQQIEGQIEGCVVQAAGYALMENFIMHNGYVLTPHLSNYLIPTVLDVPQRVKSLILEYGDAVGPWGAKGMSEMPYMPLAPAIAAAIYDATGVWIDEFPYTPDRVWRALRRGDQAKLTSQ